MNSNNDEQISSSSSDIDICNTSSNISPQKLIATTVTSTPHSTYKPRVNFHSIESLAISSLNTPNTSPFSLQKHGKLYPLQEFSDYNSEIVSIWNADDTGYSSFNSSISTFEQHNKENISYSKLTKTNERKPRRKLTDWQIWHLRQAYTNNRYPSPYEQEQLAQRLLLPFSSIRIWFQNYRARSGKK